ncbi:MAG: hypothetical protein HOJ35_06410, partial [Bdellovibrionales bacterium]|nr:hypothetical protein [Bdellovibrionales bacterium]
SLVIILFACTFHFSALSYLFLYIMNFFRDRFSSTRMVIILCIASLLPLFGFTRLVIFNLPNLGFITTKLVNYSISQYSYNLGFLEIVNLKNIFILCVLLFFRKRLACRFIYFDSMLFMYFFGIVIRIGLSDFAIMAGRIGALYTVVEVILIPSLIMLFRQKILVWFFIVFYSGLMLFLNLYSGSSRSTIQPYVMSNHIFKM